MNILPASLLDLSALLKLERACFENDSWPLLDLMAVLTFPDVVRLKAVADERMVGFVAGDPRRSKGFSWIATIGVLPEFRRRGIAREMLRACESRLITPRIRLCVRPENRPAVQLYEQEGYQQIEIWHKYYKDGGDALVMEKANGNIGRGDESPKPRLAL
ncbi:MAG: GNAT family N-acetyltransferase [Chloroflexota bacterium]